MNSHTAHQRPVCNVPLTSLSSIPAYADQMHASRCAMQLVVCQRINRAATCSASVLCENAGHAIMASCWEADAACSFAWCSPKAVGSWQLAAVIVWAPTHLLTINNPPLLACILPIVTDLHVSSHTYLTTAVQHFYRPHTRKVATAVAPPQDLARGTGRVIAPPTAASS